MTELKVFKIEQKFNGTEDLYRYLLKNVDFAGEVIGMKVQKPLKPRMFCLTGYEKITERNIFFFATESEFPENIGELIFLAGVFKADIVIFFMKDTDPNYVGGINWLQSICNDDTQFIVGEVSF